MLEKLGTESHQTISEPDWDVVNKSIELVSGGNKHLVVAEVGVGIGATTLRLATAMQNTGEIHIFDFAEQVDELAKDLEEKGFDNVVPHGNTRKYWDSYHWSLAKLINDKPREDFFDLIYIDGAHTYLHDALAFFMCDRLLKVGGLIYFDDYFWCYADSGDMRWRDEYMTSEQENSQQIRMFIEQLVKTSPAYEEVLPNKGFRKIARTTRLDRPSGAKTLGQRFVASAARRLRGGLR